MEEFILQITIYFFGEIEWEHNPENFIILKERKILKKLYSKLKEKMNKRVNEEVDMEFEYLENAPVLNIISNLVRCVRIRVLSVVFISGFLFYLLCTSEMTDNRMLMNLGLIFFLLIIIYNIEMALMSIDFTLGKLYLRGRNDALEDLKVSIKEDINKFSKDGEE